MAFVLFHISSLVLLLFGCFVFLHGNVVENTKNEDVLPIDTNESTTDKPQEKHLQLKESSEDNLQTDVSGRLRHFLKEVKSKIGDGQVEADSENITVKTKEENNYEVNVTINLNIEHNFSEENLDQGLEKNSFELSASAEESLLANTKTEESKSIQDTFENTLSERSQSGPVSNIPKEFPKEAQSSISSSDAVSPIDVSSSSGHAIQEKKAAGDSHSSVSEEPPLDKQLPDVDCEDKYKEEAPKPASDVTSDTKEGVTDPPKNTSETRDVEQAVPSKSKTSGEGAKIGNASAPPPTPRQLETYSQFAERVSAEKKHEENGLNGHTNGQPKGSKVKTKNYASPDCGAKLIAANPEANHASKIIDRNKDEYLLNQCKDKTWAIIELCESIRPQKFDVANFELYSNLPQDIHLYGSHRYPTREWSLLGHYKGQEGNRDIQSFHIETEEFFKFLKIEISSHYGNEFYCPLSLFRAFGVSEFDVIDHLDEDNSEEVEEEPTVEGQIEETTPKEKPGMIPSVIKSMLTGVLKVIQRGSRSTGKSSESEEMNTFTQNCRSLESNFSFEGTECSVADSLNYILACYYDEYVKLMSNPIINATLTKGLCSELSYSICSSPSMSDGVVYDSVCNNSYICVMLSPKHLLAMCHIAVPITYTTKECDGNVSSVNGSKITQELTESLTSSIDKKSEHETNDLPNGAFKSTDTSEDSVVDPSRVNQSKALTETNGETLTMQGATKNVAEIVETPKSKNPETLKDDSAKDSLTDRGNKTNVERKKMDNIKGNVSKSLHDEASTPSNAPSAESKIQPSSPTNKESVIVRLSNKIKALEHNMSISSQYLEELSQRYKRQMEEMKDQFDSTSQTAYERDLTHQTYIENLEKHLDKLSDIVLQLKLEKDDLMQTVTKQHMLLIVAQIVVFMILMIVLGRSRRARRPTFSATEDSSVTSVASYSLSVNDLDKRPVTPVRRWSVESIKAEGIETRQRRPSDGAIQISGNYKGLMKDSPEDESTNKKKYHKKKLKRSSSNSSLTENLSSNNLRKEEEGRATASSAGVLFSVHRKKRSSSKDFKGCNGVSKKETKLLKSRKNSAFTPPFATEGYYDTVYSPVETSHEYTAHDPIPYDPSYSIYPKVYEENGVQLNYDYNNTYLEEGNNVNVDNTYTPPPESGCYYTEGLIFSPHENYMVDPATFVTKYDLPTPVPAGRHRPVTGKPSNGKLRLKSDNWQWYASQQLKNSKINGTEDGDCVDSVTKVDERNTKKNTSGSDWTFVSSTDKKKKKKHKSLKQS